MSELSPSEAAEVAAGVCNLAKMRSSEIIDRGVMRACEGMFGFTLQWSFQARSGGRCLCMAIHDC